MKRCHQRVLALLLAMLLASCGGGGGDGGGGGTPPPAGLSGTWFGTLEDADVQLFHYSVTISGGSITQVTKDGFNTGQTGTVSQQSPEVMRYTLTAGVVEPASSGVFLVHATLVHLAFADDAANFGVLQKNAVNLPTYGYDSDLNGAWTGMALQTDFSSFFAEASSTATCAFSNPTVGCTVTNPSGTFNVTLSGAFDTTFGRWTGTYTGPTNGDAAVFLSADKTFAAAWACDLPDQIWPDDCAFYALNR